MSLLTEPPAAPQNAVMQPHKRLTMKVAFLSKANAIQAYSEYYEQYAIDASFLWLLRSIAVDQPHYTATDLAELDQRIDAQLDGLMSAPEESWDICRAAMELEEAGETFTAAIVAFRSLDVNKIQEVVELGMAAEPAFPGLVSALGWLPGRLCHSWIKRFLTSKDLDHKYLALAACSIRREDPREYLTQILQREDCVAHKKLYARALRLIGELKRRDLMPALRIGMRSDDPTTVFWACWSAILLGDQSATQGLQGFVLEANPLQSLAIQTVFRATSVEEGRALISTMAEDPKNIRNVIKATATLGDPHAVNWLIAQMRNPALSRLAGEAFTMITGIDLRENRLALEDLPDLDEHLPNDDPGDDNVALDEDENLVFPDADKVAAVWHKYHQRFAPGERHLLGKRIQQETVSPILDTGYQRQRQAAAMELALIQPDQWLFNCAGRGPDRE